MPSGFIGDAARSYLVKTSEALLIAANANPRGASRGESPYPPDKAVRGRVLTGVGNSSNIVVDSLTYTEAMRRMDSIDERMGELFYSISQELEQMCQTSYIIPQTRPRFLNVCESMKGSLGRFRDLTYDLFVTTNRFVREITEII